ncbi:Helicase PriA essential for oriC/DnaA-independent DNA replication [Arcticibacter svalbardensis MN12-7]|uniref:Replication restart protein PriA n=1 Tax=Arcticibacter svalbardensis MN12-7 TaxID=1150600 RepID=R9GWP7_9SPHI|nr:primosomal protein N' [Arcticibacter svalbardensis]EOR96227.1 Helicase PriA essential for oriC/DnaA-independent DNA replication [Arcticibacter svalbardensis MN12-7]
MLEFNEAPGEHRTFFIEVILPLSISRTYTYRVPQSFNQQIEVGKRAVVQFGKSRIYTSIIYSISEKAPSLYEAKYIIDILDDTPIVNEKQIKLWEWIASYYMCTIGEVMQAALPSALKLASETRVILLKDAEYDKADLNDKEFLIIDALEIQPELKVNEIVKLLGQKSVFKLLKSLFDKGIIHISEEVIERYKPRMKSFYRLNPFYQDDANRKALFAVLERSPKQLDAFLAFTKLSRSNPAVLKKEIMEECGCSAAIIKTLVDKEILIQDSIAVSRLPEGDTDIDEHFLLSPKQEVAYEELHTQFTHKEVVLLYGVTSSGKTQLYVRLIEENLKQGKQVLYLLPEIALTTQIVERLKKFFGNAIGIYHSRMGDNERAEVWSKVLKNEYTIILGARSAVFLPFSNLGLIVIDEEHETSYKQQDPAPRYHARDTAIYLAHLHQAKVLLGSATPSLESFYNSKTGKYGFVQLSERYGEAGLPEIQVVSIGDETNKKTIQNNFTSVLIDAIRENLEKKEQVILFQNRRGYTPMSICRTCGYISKCIHCDVSLNYHKSTHQLHCHYCGYKQDILSVCPACGSVHIEPKGFGTEKIEDDLKYIFPDARIARMDLDTTRAKHSFQHILTEFEDQKIDILVGTQIVAKGLDFSHVTLIGVINADSLLNFPDFRAFEKSFQMLSQVGGRAGRRDKAGKVIIQAYDVRHRVIDQVIHHNYEGLFKTEIQERQNFKYPPIYRMIRLDIKHKDQAVLNNASQRFASAIKKDLGSRVLGPEDPMITRIRNLYIKTIYVKIERNGIPVSKVKDYLKTALIGFEADKLNKGTFIQVDVDPY